MKCIPKEPSLYEIFRKPENKYRLFVRWWWNGDKVTKKEILRELDVMKQAGIGGVEINPIRFPDTAENGSALNGLKWLE